MKAFEDLKLIVYSVINLNSKWHSGMVLAAGSRLSRYLDFLEYFYV